jgi:hypothetical protein
MANDGTPPSALRIGTWNVLLQADEYDPVYGCPLQIVLCNRQNITPDECTRARWRRVWKAIEERSATLDVLSLQEVEDKFLAMQNTYESSNWTLIHRSGECALLLSSSYSNHYQVVATYNLTLPDLSGCPFVPLAVLQYQHPVTTGTVASIAVGSVHVQASVSNMTAWYGTAVTAIRNATTTILREQQAQQFFTRGTTSVHSPRSLFAILAGDFNHNLTNDLSVTQQQLLPDHWRLVYADAAAVDNNTTLHGTSQKEENWMGNFDGFFLSPLLSCHDDATIPCGIQHNTELQQLQLATVTEAIALVEGFMPKVVQGLTRNTNNNGSTSRTTSAAQFGVTIDGRNIISSRAALENLLRSLDNSTEQDDLQLLFSATSDFSSNEDMIHYIVPKSNPNSQALSDHLLVSASFAAVSTSGPTHAPHHLLAIVVSTIIIVIVAVVVARRIVGARRQTRFAPVATSTPEDT